MEITDLKHPPTLLTGTPNPFPSGPSPISEAACSLSSRPRMTWEMGLHPLIWLEPMQGLSPHQWANISAQHREITGARTVHKHVAAHSKVSTAGSGLALTPALLAIFNPPKGDWNAAAARISLRFYFSNLWHMQLVWPLNGSVNVLQRLFSAGLLPLLYLSSFHW